MIEEAAKRIYLLLLNGGKVSGQKDIWRNGYQIQVKAPLFGDSKMNPVFDVLYRTHTIILDPNLHITYIKLMARAREIEENRLAMCRK